MHGQAQTHDVWVEGPELQGRSIIGKGTEIDLKEVDGELPVDVVELIFVLSVGFFKILFINFFKVVKIVRTFWIDAFVNDEVFTILFCFKGM